jgi:Cadherin-like beta sandwich domain/FG-GAP-like repeat
VRAILLVALTGCAQLIGIESDQPLELAHLTVSDGTLAPAFDPSITAYTLALPYTAKQLAVEATSEDPTVTISVDDHASGTATAVPIGASAISVIAKSSTGVERTYTIAVERVDLDLAFGPPTSVFAIGAVYDVDATDVDGDGVVDLAYSTSDGYLGMVINKGSYFRQDFYLQVSGLRGFVLADVTGDSHRDLVVSNGTITMYAGVGDGSFGAAIARGMGQTTALASGRFDGDAKDDVVVANGDGNVTILLGDGGTMAMGPSWKISPTLDEPRFIAFAQLDGTGPDELVALDSSERKLATGTVVDGQLVMSPVALVAGALPSDFVTADIDGDGHTDLAVLDTIGKEVTIFTGYPSWKRTTYPLGAYARSLVAGDLDADGITDLAMIDVDDMLVLRNDGTAQFELRRFASMAHTPSYLTIGDFDRDGRNDVVFALGASELVLVHGVGR